MSISEKRMQIYLPFDLFGSLRKEARLEKKSIAHLIREAIAVYLEERRRRHIDWDKDPFTKGIGSVHDAPADLSVHHDRYLYGESKKKS